MSSFFAYLGRMKYIKRWALMRNTYEENIMQHSCEVAQIAYALAEIKNTIYNGNVNADKIGMAALFHELPEVLTGDLPTPIKYYDKEITQAYKKIENIASKKIIDQLPNELKDKFFATILPNDQEILAIVKAADKLSAYIKCLEEKKAGNKDFEMAEKSIEKEINRLCELMPEVKYFNENFIPSYSLTIDELNK